MHSLIQVSVPKLRFVIYRNNYEFSKFYYYRNTSHTGWKFPNPPTGEPLSTYTAYHYFPPKIFFYTYASIYHYILPTKVFFDQDFYPKLISTRHFRPSLFNIQTETTSTFFLLCFFSFVIRFLCLMVMEFTAISWQSPKMPFNFKP